MMLRWVLAAVLSGTTIWPAYSGEQESPPFSTAERALIATLGPWPPRVATDPSNKFSRNQRAIELGRALFFDPRLSGSGTHSCASCHRPEHGFTDARKLGLGIRALQRNTPSVVDLSGRRWYGWGGESDSLWAQSIRPLLDSREMNNTPAALVDYIENEARLRERFERLAGFTPVARDATETVVALGKFLAAFQETLVSPRSPFDHYRDALAAGDKRAEREYPEGARRGLRLFIGRGRCILCHSGPHFSNGEFADIGVDYFTEDGVDSGRYGGIQQLRSNPFNLLGDHNDAATSDNRMATQHVHLLPRNWGEFKVPTLRQLSMTAPFMHNGSLADIDAVIDHYSELDESRLHSDAGNTLVALRLTKSEREDLRSFLLSLDARSN